MNYRRGFKRIFTVAAVCWIGFWVVVGPRSVLGRLAYSSGDWAKDINFVKAADGLVDSVKTPATHAVAMAQLADLLVDPLATAFIPPVLAYIFFFLMVPWIAKGFKS